MTVVPETETRERPLTLSLPACLKNSPFLYGLGTLGLSAVAHAFGGYYTFYYVNVLGLAVGLAAIVNVFAGQASASAQVRIRPRSEEPQQRLFLPFVVDSSHG